MDEAEKKKKNNVITKKHTCRKHRKYKKIEIKRNEEKSIYIYMAEHEQIQYLHSTEDKK